MNTLENDTVGKRHATEESSLKIIPCFCLLFGML